MKYYSVTIVIANVADAISNSLALYLLKTGRNLTEIRILMITKFLIDLYRLLITY